MVIKANIITPGKKTVIIDQTNITGYQTRQQMEESIMDIASDDGLFEVSVIFDKHTDQPMTEHIVFEPIFEECVIVAFTVVGSAMCALNTGHIVEVKLENLKIDYDTLSKLAVNS